MKFVKYNVKHKNNIKEIITDNTYALNKVLRYLEQNPENSILTIYNNTFAAISAFSCSDDSADLILYVNPEYRCKGIGSSLLLNTEKIIRESGIKYIYCIHPNLQAEKSFSRKHGYSIDAKGSTFIYSGEKYPDTNFEIISYEDRFYSGCHNVITSAFHKMQVEAGVEEESYVYLPNKKENLQFKMNAKNIFVLRDKDEIVGVLILKDNEIDLMAVSVQHQCKGYGRALLSFGVNKLLDNGNSTIELHCIEGNPAFKFYEKAGFERINDSVLVKHML